jgi:hypothetical protein
MATFATASASGFTWQVLCAVTRRPLNLECAAMRAVLFLCCFFALAAGILGQVPIYSFTDWNATTWQVAAAGDVNGDGYPDIAARGFISTASSPVRVWSGKDGRILWTMGRLVTALSGPMGDVNGDGADDFAITDARVVDILSGRDGSVLRSMSDPADVGFGWALAGIGDTDGDGVGDLLAGSDRFSSGGLTTRGRVQVFSGRTGQVLFSASGIDSFDQMGSAVANAGDVDGDGTNDFLVWMNSMRLWSAGVVFLVAGRTFQLIDTFQGAAPQEYLGAQVRGIGDVDRDGRADFMMVGMNTLQVRSGRTRALLHTRSVQNQHDCAGLGDVDGDGWPDLGVDGRTIVSGRTFMDIAQLAPVPPVTSGYLAGVGDLNGDGRADVVQSAGPLAAWSVTPLPLRSTSHTLSASAGGQQDFGFAAADLQPHWGKLYVLLGTVSGTRPGIRLGNLVLPLNHDPWFDLLAMNPNTLVAGSFGTVAAVMPDARLSLLPGAANALAGQTLFHAFVVIDPLRLSFDFVSNAVPLALLP